MNGEQILVSVGIIGGIATAFGSIGFLCCYFKSKCSTLNEPEPEFRHLRSTSKASNNSLTSTTSATTNTSYIDRRTLFQIVMGPGPAEKPLRARMDRKSSRRWSQKLSFLRRSKSLKMCKLPGRVSDLATMEEAIEEDCDKIATR